MAAPGIRESAETSRLEASIPPPHSNFAEGIDSMCNPKGKGRKPKEFNFKDNTYAQDALVFGEPATKEIYEKF